MPGTEQKFGNICCIGGRKEGKEGGRNEGRKEGGRKEEKKGERKKEMEGQRNRGRNKRRPNTHTCSSIEKTFSPKGTLLSPEALLTYVIPRKRS